MKENRLIDVIKDYIEESISEESTESGSMSEKKMTLDAIAKSLHYSKFYLNRVFASETGSTIYKYMQTRRLAEAARKLTETEKPIIEIAYEAAYNSQQAFTLAFRKEYEISPYVYRRQTKEQMYTNFNTVEMECKMVA